MHQAATIVGEARHEPRESTISFPIGQLHQSGT
jgi:hypothetical protein